MLMGWMTAGRGIRRERRYVAEKDDDTGTELVCGVRCRRIRMYDGMDIYDVSECGLHTDESNVHEGD